MGKIEVSVIFATYNREDIICDVLDAWAEVAKRTKYSFEIICSDDESSDNTVKLIKNYEGLPIVVLNNEHGGASKARNAALKVAKGDLIIFTGDDIFPTVDFIDKHYENYIKFGSKMCTLGRTEWHEEVPMNHLMTHITNIGCEQFGFAGLIPYGIADFRHFYTSNISVARSELEKLDKFFDLSFDRYGFEDIELGYRLYKNGVSIFYDPDVLAYHHHIYDSVEKFCNRQINAGSQLVVMTNIHEELKVLPTLGANKFERYMQKCITDYNVVKREYDTTRGSEIKRFIENKKNRVKELEKLIKQNDKIEYRDECSAIYRFIFRFFSYIGWGERLANVSGLNSEEISSTIFQAFLYEMIYDFVYSSYTQVFVVKDGDISEQQSTRYEKEGCLINIDVQMGENDLLRVDPLNRTCMVKNFRVVDKKKNKELKHFFTNGKDNKISDFSGENDSQVMFKLHRFKKNADLNISFEIHSCSDLETEMNNAILEEASRNNNYYKRVEQPRNIKISSVKYDEMVANYKAIVEKKFGTRIIFANDEIQEDFRTNYVCEFGDNMPTPEQFLEICRDIYYAFTPCVNKYGTNIKMMNLGDIKEDTIEDEGLLSVIIPSYNHEKYIGYAIDSVLNQTYSNLELIIVDDGSKDSSVEIIKGYNDERIKLIIQENAGAHNAINKGLSLAKGKYLAILNSDDSFASRRFEIMIKEMKKVCADFSCSYIQIIDSDNNNLGIKHGDIDMLPWGQEQPGESYYAIDDFGLNLVMTNFTSTTSNFLFTRELYEKIGGMRNLRFAHDWDFALRAAQQFKCITIDKPLMEYRVHNANTISSNRAWMLFEIAWMWATNLGRYYDKGVFTGNDKTDVRKLGNSLNIQGNDKVFWMIKTFIESKLDQGIEHPEELLLDDAELRQEFINFVVV